MVARLRYSRRLDSVAILGTTRDAGLEAKKVCFEIPCGIAPIANLTLETFSPPDIGAAS